MHYCINNWNGSRGQHNHKCHNHNHNSNKHNDYHKIRLKNHSGDHLENHDQRGEVSTHRGIESSWTTNHLTVTEMTKGTLDAMVADKKGISERTAWQKVQI